MIFAPCFTITNAITAGLTTIERARGFLQAATLSEEWVRRMSQRALLLEAHHTTHIEGTELTIEQAERAWAGERVTEARPDDVRELLNYREAFNLVSTYLESGEPITEGLIREIHKRLVAGVRGGEGGPGAYRNVQNYVANSRTGEVVYTPPPPHDVPPMMADLVRWLNVPGDVHPVLISGLAQFQFVHIHPFVDGNGRVGRCLIHVVYRQRGLAPSIVPPISLVLAARSDAYVAGLGSFRSGDPADWLEFFAVTAIAGVRHAESLGVRLDQLRQDWIDMAGNPRSDSSIRALIERLPAEPVLSVARAMKIADVSRPAAARAVDQLADSTILRPLDARERNRHWEAPAVFALLDDFERELLR